MQSSPKIGLRTLILIVATCAILMGTSVFVSAADRGSSVMRQEATDTPTATPTNTVTTTSTPTRASGGCGEDGNCDDTSTPANTPTPPFTPTPIPITLVVSLTCDSVGNVTATISNSGNAIPASASFGNRLLNSANAAIVGTTGTFSGPIPPAAVVTKSTLGNFGLITFQIRSPGTSIPAGYVLTNPLPMNTAVTCIEPTPTPTPTATDTPTVTNMPTITPTFTATPIPLTIAVSLTCDDGIVTATVTNIGNAIPASATFGSRLLDSSNTPIVGTTGAFGGPIPPDAIVTKNTLGNFGVITFQIRSPGTSIPAGYALTNPLPMNTSVTCTAPTPTPTNTAMDLPTPTMTDTATDTPVPTNTWTNTPIPPTNTNTPTPTPTNTSVTLAVTTTCNSVGVVTATLTFSPTLPSNATVNYVLRQGTVDISGTSGSTTLTGSKNVTVSTNGVYGSIVFRVTSVTMPSRYVLTTSLPLNATAVACTQPTNTLTPTPTHTNPAPTNTPTRTFTWTNTPTHTNPAPTNTWTPSPTVTHTSLPTSTRTPTPTPTDPDSGGGGQ